MIFSIKTVDLLSEANVLNTEYPCDVVLLNETSFPVHRVLAILDYLMSNCCIGMEQRVTTVNKRILLRVVSILGEL